MSFAWIEVYVVICDNCKETTIFPTSDNAKTVGWVRTEYKANKPIMDFCPDCASIEESKGKKE